MEELLVNLGFVDITKDAPIVFTEQLPTTFDNIYSLNKRFKRVNNGITTFLLIGREYNQIHVIGDSYCRNTWSRFCLQVLEEYIKEPLLLYINANEEKIQKLLEENSYGKIILFRL